MTVRAEEVSPADLESIERAARDYIESWMTGDADRMADCLHTELVKRALHFDGATGGISIETMTHADMVAATAEGHGKDMPRDYEVNVVDAFRNAATATVDSARYVDYLQIGRFEDRWRIVNVLYEPLKRR
jgi:signal transduction histidine kinase